MKKYILVFLVMLFSNVIYAGDILVGFSRDKPSAKDIVLQAISEADTSIYLEAYQLTSITIVNALIDAKKRGVDVNVLVDRSSQNSVSKPKLAAAGINCFVDTKFKIMHDKVMIIDHTHVQTGSFNYTVSADRSNAENAVYIKNVPGLALKYKTQWDFLVKTTKPCI